MKRFGLIGYPLSHSFSQKYFSEKFKKENISDAVYENFSIQSIDLVRQIVATKPDLVGLNVTIPYKQSVLAYLDEKKNLPIQACNCIWIREGKMIGYNTDITGFERSFVPGLEPYHKSALILGNGGATEAVKYVLKKMNIDFVIVSRKENDHSLHYRDLSRETMTRNLVIINTTPVGMYPNVDDAPPIPYECISDRHYLFDLIYNPTETLFLKKGKERGATVRNGQEMLIIQAEESWRIWNAL